MDQKTLALTSLYKIEIAKSKFIAIAFPVQDEVAIKQKIKEVKKEYPKATHYCYGFVLEGSHMRSSDDGEPSGTAGVPIMMSIQRMGFSHVLVIVVRYFGGTLLGASGLTKAYREATESVLKQASLSYWGWREHYEVTLPIELTAVMDYWVQSHECHLIERTFHNQSTLYQLYTKNPQLLSLLTNDMNGKATIHSLGLCYIAIHDTK